MYIYSIYTNTFMFHEKRMENIRTTLDMLMIYRLYNYITWLNFVFTLQISGNLIPRAAE